MMYLVIAATEMELEPIREILGREGNVSYLVSGVGPLETCLQLTRFLAGRREQRFGAVLQVGVAGAYGGGDIQILDLCLAEKEVVGDFGICTGEGISSFARPDLQVVTEFSLRSASLGATEEILAGHGIPYHTGTFVTVNCTSGTAERGIYLRDRYQAICENMEGAATARVCEVFGLPCIELRCISNMVEKRSPARWRLTEAVQKNAEAAAVVIRNLQA
jgi:futalosine hydrolase